MHIYILVILALKKSLERFFGEHYPKEIIPLIILKSYELIKIKIHCGNDRIITLTLTSRDKLCVWESGSCQQIDTKEEEIESNIMSIKYWKKSVNILMKSGHLYRWYANKDFPIFGGNTYTLWKSQLNIKKIDFKGSVHKLFLTTSNELYVHGSNKFGQLGLDIPDAYTCKPLKINLKNVVSVRCGWCHTLALTDQNKIYSWGLNDMGQLGLGDTYNRYSPQAILLDRIISIRCGHHHNVAIGISGEVFVWGSNVYNQLGLDKIAVVRSANPQKLFLNGETIISARCGNWHTIALTKSRELYVWGRNNYGQLGLGHNEIQTVPQKIFLHGIMSINCGEEYNVVTTLYNKIYIWGQDVLDEDKMKNTPIQIESILFNKI